MDTLVFTAGNGKYKVNAAVTLCGSDISLVITGGTHPHIGAVAMGVPRPSLRNTEQNSASASVLTAIGHKEDELVRNAALQLASAFDCYVSVSAGIHVDNASKDEIETLWHNYEIIMSDLKNRLQEIFDPILLTEEKIERMP